jgi:hypothetical protein
MRWMTWLAHTRPYKAGGAAATAEVHVTVSSSPLRAVLAGGAGPRILPKGVQMVLDASGRN